MTLEVKTCVFLGVEVEENLFWTIHNDVKERCEKGHERDSGRGPFCDKCGTKFEQRGMRLPTKNYISLCKYLELGNNYEDNYLRIWSSGILRSIFCVSPHVGAKKRMVLSNGNLLTSVQSTEKTEMNGFRLDQLENQIELLKKVSEVVGADTSEIRIYAQQIKIP